VVWWWPEDPGLGQTANNGVRLASNNPRTPDQKIKPIPTLYKTPEQGNHTIWCPFDGYRDCHPVDISI